MPRGDRSRLVAGTLLFFGAAILAGLAAYAVLGLGEDEEGPEGTAQAFAAAWSSGDGEALRALVTDPATIDAVDPVDIGTDLGATATDITVGLVDEDPDEARARFTATLTLGDVGEVSWDGELPLVEVEDAGWRVAWSEPAMHPRLERGGSITRTTTWPAAGADPRRRRSADHRRRRAGPHRHRAEAVRPGGVDPDPRRSSSASTRRRSRRHSTSPGSSPITSCRSPSSPPRSSRRSAP